MIRIPTLAACVVALGTLGAVSSAEAACKHPDAPKQLPDGTTATKDEMIAANQAVKQYISDMDAYLACIDAEAPKMPTDKISDEQRAQIVAAQKMTVEKHNAAVAEEEAMRDDWHQRLTAYKERQPK
jgi:hypothetical protein